MGWWGDAFYEIEIVDGVVFKVKKLAHYATVTCQSEAAHRAEVALRNMKPNRVVEISREPVGHLNKDGFLSFCADGCVLETDPVQRRGALRSKAENINYITALLSMSEPWVVAYFLKIFMETADSLGRMTPSELSAYVIRYRP